MDIVPAIKRSFKQFDVLPSELRMMIVDEMSHYDRFIFSHCSKYSTALARESKKYIYGLEAIYLDRSSFVIRFIVAVRGNRQLGYLLRICEENGIKYKICRNFGEEELWREQLDNSTDLFDYGKECFIQALNYREKSIKRLLLAGTRLTNIVSEIRFLKNLEELVIDGDLDIPQFFTKLRRPLEKLEIRRANIITPLIGLEQIFDVKHSLHLFDLALSNEQFRRLTARIVHIPIGNLTSGNIVDFINSWKSLTIDGTEGNYQLEHSDDPSFHIHISNVFLELGYNFLLSDGYTVNIPHDHDANKAASLTYSGNILKFRWSTTE